MIRGAAILLTIAYIFMASPHRTPESLSFGGAATAGTPPSTAAQAALATAILRGSLPEAAGKLVGDGAGAIRAVRQVGP